MSPYTRVCPRGITYHIFLTQLTTPGATGLIQVLAEDYLSTLPEQRSVEWICNHSRNTQLALLHGHVDVALTYERSQETLAASEGWSRSAGCVMHDHFCLAGPVDDPAGLRSAPTLADGLHRIFKSEALFHSRVDLSATMWKERTLWKACGYQPDVNDASVARWYQTSLLSPAEALKSADAAGAYLVTDRSTLLRQVSLGSISKTTVFFEPEAEDDVLMNSCYALCSPAAGPETRAFVEYLLGDRAQSLIESYGRDKAGFPLFAKAADGFARTTLRGGRPIDMKWVVS